jgi:hypothetical protein
MTFMHVWRLRLSPDDESGTLLTSLDKVLKRIFATREAEIPTWRQKHCAVHRHERIYVRNKVRLCGSYCFSTKELD